MPDFPVEDRIGTLFYTNMTEWLRRTGVLPDFISATFVMDPTFQGVYCPITIPRPMLVQKFYVANGASVNGNHQVSLCNEFFSPSPFVTRPYPFSRIYSQIALQTGTAQWQALSIAAPRRVAAGRYWLAYVSSSSTGTVQRLFNPLSATSGQSRAGGIFRGARYPLTGGQTIITTEDSIVVPCLAVGGIP